MSDANETDWKSTLILNLERAVAAGAFWTVVLLLWRPPGHSLGELLKWLYQFPLSYLLVLMPLGILAAKLHRHGIQWAGVFAGFVSLLILVGDPFVYMLHKLIPAVVPVEKFNMFNRVLVILVSR
jgi:hypothetical protein